VDELNRHFSTEEATMSDGKVPYEKGSQIATFAIHGTTNEPAHVRDVASRIHHTLVANNPTGKDLLDTFFRWDAPLHNGNSHREIAANQLTTRAVESIVQGVKDGTLDPNKALVVNLVGFSHGGNVALRAADDIVAALKEHPLTKNINLGMHITTLSAPAYTAGAESPTAASNGVERQGVAFAHTHISVQNDGVIRLGVGNSNYDSNTTSNITLPALNGNPIDNHGAPQNVDWYMNRAVEEVVQTFNNRTRRQENHADAGSPVLLADASPVTRSSDGSQLQFDRLNPQPAENAASRLSTVSSENAVASLIPATHNNSAQSLEFKNNPTVQQVSAALDRNGIAADQNPSLVAGLAGAAANLSKVQDVALTPQTAFALDRDKSDPAANRVQVSMDVANKPFDEVWQKASVALQQAQAPAVVAQAQAPAVVAQAQAQDVEQKSARAM
jgi:hypothetical protein